MGKTTANWETLGQASLETSPDFDPSPPGAAEAPAVPERLIDDPYWDGWRLEQEMHDIDQMLATWKLDPPPTHAREEGSPPPPVELGGSSSMELASAKHSAAAVPAAHRGVDATVWALLLAGLLAAFAATLQAAAAWSLKQPAPWQLILQCAFTGQILVLLGLIGHLRAAQRRQEHLERAVASLRRAMKSPGRPVQSASAPLHSRA